MTATAAVVSIKAQGDTVQQISIDRLVPSEHNPRATFDKTSLNELAQSIMSSGIQVPLLARPFPAVFYVSTGIAGDENSKVYYRACKNLANRENLVETFSAGSPLENRKAAEASCAKHNRAGFYEIVAGHRRVKAAAIAKLKEVPCIVRQMTDSEAHETRILENLQREDLRPMEEAESYQQMFQRAGDADTPMTPGALAAKIGKPESYVRLRLRLLSADKGVQEALRKDEITLGHALELARLDQAAQKGLLVWLQYHVNYDGRRGSKRDNLPSLAEFRRHITQEVMLDLAKAPFDAKDAQLVPEAGSCVDCKKRTGNNTLLFADVKQGDTCTDPRCFEGKIERLIQIEVAKASGQLVRISDRYGRQGLEKDVLESSEYIRLDSYARNAKQRCDHLLIGIFVDGDKRGQKVRICTDAHCKVHSYSSGASAASDDTKKKQAAAKIEACARLRIFQAIFAAAKDVEMDEKDYLDVAAYAIDRADTNGVKRLVDMLGWPKEKGSSYIKRDAIRKQLEEMGSDRAVAIAKLAAVSGYLSVSWYSNSKPQEFEALAKDFGVDTAAIRKQVAEEKKAKVKPKVVTTTERKGGRGESPEPLSGASNQKRPGSVKAATKKKATATVTKGGKK